MLFPIFLNIADRPALIVGGGRAAAAKADLLRRAGAQVTVIARDSNQDLRRMEKEGEIILSIRSFKEIDMPGNALVIVASDDPCVIKPVVGAAHRAHIPVNVVDAPEQSNFVMPAIIDRNPVVVAISTSGTAPVLARSIRAKIEAMLPANLGRLARFADGFRSAVRSIYPDLATRRHFWERFFTSPTAAAVLAGEETKAREHMVAHVNQTRSRRQLDSQLQIVFADFAAPDLLTLRGLQILQEADAIVYDTGGEEIVRRYARREAEVIQMNDDECSSSFSAANLPKFFRKHALYGPHLVWLIDVRRQEFVSSQDVSREMGRSGVAVEIVPGVIHALAPHKDSRLRATG